MRLIEAKFLSPSLERYGNPRERINCLKQALKRLKWQDCLAIMSVLIGVVGFL